MRHGSLRASQALETTQAHKSPHLTKIIVPVPLGRFSPHKNPKYEGNPNFYVAAQRIPGVGAGGRRGPREAMEMLRDDGCRGPEDFRAPVKSSTRPHTGKLFQRGGKPVNFFRAEKSIFGRPKSLLVRLSWETHTNNHTGKLFGCPPKACSGPQKVYWSVSRGTPRGTREFVGPGVLFGANHRWQTILHSRQVAPYSPCKHSVRCLLSTQIPQTPY